MHAQAQPPRLMTGAAPGPHGPVPDSRKELSLSVDENGRPLRSITAAAPPNIAPMTRSASPADFDFSRWPELRLDLPDNVSPVEAQTLAWHIAEQMVGWFGVDQFEAYRGKEGLQLHGVDELAAVMVAKLAPLWQTLPAGAISRLQQDVQIAQPLIHPWDKTS